VGTVVETIAEPAGFTPARGPNPATRGRTLPTTFWYPVHGPAGPADRPGAPPLAGRPFPVVVFAHGFDVAPSTYRVFLHALAAAGLVVAAPLFPISGSGPPGPPREDDQLRQTGDLSTVITWILGHRHVSGLPAAAADPDRVAIVGHSDGAESAAMMLLYPPYLDRRVRAAVLLGGQALPGPVQPLTGVPVLVEQGDADTINPPGLGRGLFAQLGGPKAYLELFRGTHLGALIGPEADAADLQRFVAGFLLSVLGPAPATTAELERLGNQPGLTGLALVGAWP